MFFSAHKSLYFLQSSWTLLCTSWYISGFILSHFLKIKTFTITWSLGIAFILLLHSCLWQILVTYAVSLRITNNFKSFSFVVSFTPLNSLFKLTMWSSPFYKWEHLNGLEIFKYIYNLGKFNVLPEIAQLPNAKTWIQTQISGSCERWIEDLLFGRDFWSGRKRIPADIWNRIWKLGVKFWIRSQCHWRPTR